LLMGGLGGGFCCCVLFFVLVSDTSRSRIRSTTTPLGYDPLVDSIRLLLLSRLGSNPGFSAAFSSCLTPSSSRSDPFRIEICSIFFYA